MKPLSTLLLAALAGLSALAASSAAAGRAAPPQERAQGWLNWRGPLLTGVSAEKGLPDRWAPGGPNDLWSIPIGGGGTPVIANGRLYALGYRGQGPDLHEVVFCADAETGRIVWEHRFYDFLSDIIYDRYAIGGPTIDPETGSIYVFTAAGIFSCFAPDGKLLWQHSMMEKWGRLTFPNGRSGAPLIENDLVIIRYITSNWGGEGAAADRFYAFDKRTGELVWSSAPGDRPKDNSFAMPIPAWRKGKRVLYSGDGSGHVVCLNARTGEPIFRFPLSAGGCNSTVLLHGDKVIAIHADENLDSSEIGRMTAVNVLAEGSPAETGAPILAKTAEVWRNPLVAWSSSPVLVGDRIYQTTKTGQLACVDATNGKVLWEHKLGPDQLHASPTYADGKLYVPIQNGQFFILRPTATGVEELSKTQLDGRCIGAPAVWNGKVYVFSTSRLYCLGRKGGRPQETGPRLAQYPAPGKAVALQVIPSEVLLRPGEKARVRVRGIDANGIPTGSYEPSRVRWARFIPPTARVRSEMNGEFNSAGELVAAPAPQPSAGAFRGEVDGIAGTMRGRVLPGIPFSEDFQGYDLAVQHMTEAGVKFAYPPLPWIGARFKFEVRELDGNKVLAKTLDNTFFQRATVFFGHPDESGYTLEADVRADGNRRTQSTVGLINQRYLIQLLGNSQELEISSNQERLKVGTPFRWLPGQWYRLKTRVDVAPDGSGVVRAKAWKKGEPEPAGWTLEAKHAVAHRQGSPGLFGFSPQSLFRCYIDNIAITRNQ